MSTRTSAALDAFPVIAAKVAAMPAHTPHPGTATGAGGGNP
ncbi:hypothetical protein [Streptacidiphilus albus]|nr:hypothetical protein [Streptacidiphilus albus]